MDVSNNHLMIFSLKDQILTFFLIDLSQDDWLLEKYFLKGLLVVLIDFLNKFDSMGKRNQN